MIVSGTSTNNKDVVYTHLYLSIGTNNFFFYIIKGVYHLVYVLRYDGIIAVSSTGSDYNN